MYIDDNDKKQIEALSKIVQPEWTFCDIGVCQGAMLLPMSQMMKFGWGFEAKPSNMNYLNTIFDNIPNVEIFNQAVGDTNGIVSLYEGRDTHTASMNENFIQDLMGKNGLQRKFEVGSVRLDSFFEDKDVDVIKMDIEGAEWTALSGAKNLLENRDIIWLIEFHVNEEWDNRKMLYDLGYDIYDRDTFQKLDRDIPRVYQAFVCREGRLTQQ